MMSRLCPGADVFSDWLMSCFHLLVWVVVSFIIVLRLAHVVFGVVVVVVGHPDQYLWCVQRFPSYPSHSLSLTLAVCLISFSISLSLSLTLRWSLSLALSFSLSLMLSIIICILFLSVLP